MYAKRGVLILEEGLSALESSLKSRNFWVHMISAVAADQQMDLLVAPRPHHGALEGFFGSGCDPRVRHHRYVAGY